ncbi:TetR/AcrR family transcriptional regulator [Paenarthrobacter nitroguajacolicus]|uniref:TetR/AcrR family transcriptional regulator n=1 Tax=Paenarthrobacter nitroguajacolicus TaxID=211146 RepID=UPI003D2415B2
MAESRGPYKKGVQRRQEILEAAQQVFGKFGYVGGSLQQIADQVGVSRAALVRYFPDKESLLTALLQQWEADNTERAQSKPGLENIRGLMNVVRFNVEHRGSIELFLTLATEASNPAHPAHAFMAERYKDSKAYFLGELMQAISSGEVRPMHESHARREIEGLFALLDGLQIQWLLDPQADIVSMVQYHLDTTIARWKGTMLGAGQPIEMAAGR